MVLLTIRRVSNFCMNRIAWTRSAFSLNVITTHSTISWVFYSSSFIPTSGTMENLFYIRFSIVHFGFMQLLCNLNKRCDPTPTRRFQWKILHCHWIFMRIFRCVSCTVNMVMEIDTTGQYRTLKYGFHLKHIKHKIYTIEHRVFLYLGDLCGFEWFGK